MSEKPNKFYLTTPIYYVNARPHIGHAYTTIVADVLARRHRLLGDDVFFLTGTDEHGQKIERSAAAAGIAPQQFADGVSAEFQKLWDRMGLTYDKFIRTTDPAHAQGVQKLFRTLYERGFIYLSTYTGAYCVSDEAFIDVPVGEPCPDCGRVTEQVTEENFFFKLSAFQQPLIDLIESGTLAVEPESRRNEVLSFLRGPWGEAVLAATNEELGLEHIEPVEFSEACKLAVRKGIIAETNKKRYLPGALKDLSISRSSFMWGIPVPRDVQHTAGATQNHVIYVWLDALANYMTAIGYGSDLPDEQRQFAHYWPAHLHLVGKEIIRFHCVYWPAFLLAADLPLPKAITAHGWLLFDNSKMSKSKGNIVRTETILEAFGSLCPPVHVSGEAAQYGKGTASAVPSDTATNGALAPEVRPATLAERDLFASDVLRYFLLREIPFGQDGSFSFDALITRYNADLANGYGNLVSRTLRLVQQNLPSFERPKAPWLCPDRNVFWEGDEPKSREETYSGTHFIQTQVTHFYKFCADTLWPSNKLQIILAEAMLRVGFIDSYLSFHKPWLLAKSQEDSDRRKLIEVLYTASEAIRILTVALYPVLPTTTARVWAQLGLGDIEAAAANGELKNLEWGGLQPGTKLGPLAPIFPRADKGLAQIMIDMENDSQQTNSKLTSGHDPSSLESSKLAAEQSPIRPEAKLKQAFTPAPAAPVSSDPTHPAAPPIALDEPSGALPVAGSTAHTTGADSTPSHAAAASSGIFAQQPSGASTLSLESSPSPQITIDDFAKVELRVAEIKVCARIPKADKLLRLEVDLGQETRQILSGIAEFYTPEDLVGRRIIVITNLAPRKMRGLDSHGMLLAASGPEVDGQPGKPILATVPEGVPLGSRLK